MPLEPPVRVLRLMRRIEMGTKLGIRSLRTGTSDSHARAFRLPRARVRISLRVRLAPARVPAGKNLGPTVRLQVYAS